jgi:hypothetical protein
MEEMDETEERRSSLLEGRERSTEEFLDLVAVLSDGLPRATGIRWVSIAAGGGFLLKRLLGFGAWALRFSSSFFTFFSCFFLSSAALLFDCLVFSLPRTDQVGEWHIEGELCSPCRFGAACSSIFELASEGSMVRFGAVTERGGILGGGGGVAAGPARVGEDMLARCWVDSVGMSFEEAEAVRVGAAEVVSRRI